MRTVRSVFVSRGILATVFILSLSGFILLARAVTRHSTDAWDAATLLWIHAQSSVLLDNFFVVITDLGASVAVATAAFIALIFARRGWWRRAITVAASVGGAAVINLVLKLLFERLRPELWVSPIVETGFSFPSGHAMISSSLLVSLAIIAWSTRWRWIAIIGGGSVMILIGLSRLYLGVHYPVDVLAGWCASTAWVMLVVGIVWWKRPGQHLVQ